MITVQEADQLLSNHTRLYEAGPVGLTEATGRILREDIAADRDSPPFHRVAMDGIAIRHAAWQAGHRQFRVQNLQRAGVPPMSLGGDGACIEIMTGAVLPIGCDAVIRYEDLRMAEATATLNNDLHIDPMHNVHLQGNDQKANEIVLRSGTRLNATHIAVLASVGKSQVRVASLPRIVVFSNGDELVDVDQPVLPHQIRRSNAYAIRAALLDRGLADITLVHANDEREVLQARLSKALAEADVVILSGGVSMGRFDLVPAVMKDLGVRSIFHKITQKPGKPLWFGMTPADQPIFGLPGNPVSMLVCLYRYVLPYLQHAMGGKALNPRTALLAAIQRRNNNFTSFLPAKLVDQEAHVVGNNGSGDFFSLVGSDGFIEVSPVADAGTLLPFFPWSGG